MATTHDKIVSNRYKLMKKPYQAPKLNYIAIYLQDLNTKIKNTSKKITPETEKKYKKLMQEDIRHFQEKIFSDPQIYGLFLGDYISRNPKIMGNFKDKLLSVSKKIGSLNFTNLSPSQISSKMSEFFEENLQGEALDLSNNIQAEYEKQRKAIVKARIEQWWRQEKLAGTANTVKSLSLSELEAYLMNTPEILNDDSVTSNPENLSNQEFNKLVENAITVNPVDQVQVLSHDFCKFKDCVTENGDINKDKIEAAAKVANETGAEIHLSKVFEPISYTDCPVLINYTSDEIKSKIGEYLTCINQNFTTLSSATFVSDVLYDFDVESYNSFVNGNYSSDNKPEMVEARKRTQPTAPSKEYSQEEINEIYSNILTSETNGKQTIVEESISTELPHCVWEDKFGPKWYVDLFEMGMEYLPQTTLYYSEKGLDTPPKAKAAIDVLNDIRDREIKLEEETEQQTGNNVNLTLVGGLELDMSNQITTDQSPNYDVLSSVVKSVYLDGLENGGIPVRISGLEVIPETTKTSSDDEITKAQEQKWNELGEFLVDNAYNIAPGGAEFNSTIFKNQDDSTSISFDAKNYLEYLNEQMENSKLHKKPVNTRSTEYASSQSYM